MQMMGNFFTRITETNKNELYLPNSNDMVYYTELNEWYTTGAFRNFSVKVVLDKQINYRIGHREIKVTADKCLLAVKQPEVKAYYSFDKPVKSICVDINTNTIAEVYAVLKDKEPDFDNYTNNYFSIPGFEDDTFFYRNSNFASRIEKLANDIRASSQVNLNKEWFYGI
jgi:AraC family transcriptional regulator